MNIKISLSSLSFFSLGYSDKISYEYFLDILKKQNLLFNNKNMIGVIPLSANTILINCEINNDNSFNRSFKGKFYFKAIADNKYNLKKLIVNTKKVLKEMNFTIYNQEPKHER